MPPRHAYWTIIVGNLPTAFRAAHREELLPTFEQLRRRHPDAVLRWFARGRLWESPEAARERPARKPDIRGRDWRPGGSHRDPRDRFRKERQARWREVRERSYVRKRTAGERRRQPPLPPKHESPPKHVPPPKQVPPPKHEPPPRHVPEPPKPPPPEKIVVPGGPAERGSRRRDGSKRSGERPARRGPKRR